MSQFDGIGDRKRSRPLAGALVGLSWALLLALIAGTSWGAIPVPERAYGEGVVRDGEPRVRARLLVHPDDRGSSNAARVGVFLEMDPGWHVYGPDPGDSGVATKLRWRVEGAEVGPVLWPAVETFEEAGGLFTTYGYSNEVLLAVPLAFEPGAPAAREVHVDVDVLACSVECIPATFSLQRAIGLESAGPRSVEETTRQVFARFAPALRGSAAARSGAPVPSLVSALVLAFLGGLILNLMPCVLPVLAIKMFSLAELAERERSSVVSHAFAYLLGVLSTMLALGALVIGLRAAGTAVGWGFQFQEPLFVAGIATVLVIFALNLFGVFEIQFGGGRLADVGTTAAGARRSFFEGLLVVVLATPCSAPFLGTAVGFAFASAPLTILAIFAAIGLGLAAPYVAIALVPGWARFMPRSGMWMLYLRKGLGFILLATTVWLLWVFGRSVGIDGMAVLLAFLVAVAAGVWGISLLPAASGSRVPRLAALALAIAALTGLVGIRDAFDGATPSPVTGIREWSPYDPAEVAAQVAGGRPAFVAFTADWCITCKLNESQVLLDERVRGAFERQNVALFVADWTRRDESIRAELARFGRAGVPLYLVYQPLSPEQPSLLPELLRIDDVVDAVSRHSAARKVSRITQASPRASM